MGAEEEGRKSREKKAGARRKSRLEEEDKNDKRDVKGVERRMKRKG